MKPRNPYLTHAKRRKAGKMKPKEPRHNDEVFDEVRLLIEDEDEDNGAKPAEDASGAKDRSESAPSKPPKPKAAKAPEKAKRPAEASSAGSR